MSNFTANSPVLRAGKSVSSFGQPNDGTGTGPDAREIVPVNAYGAQIAQTAIQSIGVLMKDISRTMAGTPEYAAAVSILFTRATNQDIILGTVPKHVLSTSTLYNSLLHDRRFKAVPMSVAAPGDIVIETSKTQAAGYAGVVVDHGRVVSMGTAGAVQNNQSLREIQRSGQPVTLFRYIGVQKFGNCLLVNGGYNPDEPRLPAGQPGGGQWTSGGAAGMQNRKGRAETARSSVALLDGKIRSPKGRRESTLDCQTSDPKRAVSAASTGSSNDSTEAMNRRSPLPGSGGKEVLEDKVLLDELESTYQRLQAADPAKMSFQDYKQFMATFDTSFYNGVQYDYNGAVIRPGTYPGYEVNYIGVGMALAARGLSWTQASADIYLWKAYMYQETADPTYGTKVFADLGCNFYFIRKQLGQPVPLSQFNNKQRF